MARTSRRTLTHPVVLSTAILLVGCVVIFMMGRPVSLVGLQLDGALQIMEGSQLPSPVLRPGDRVVGVNGTPTSDRRELGTALHAAAGDTVNVRVALQGRTETLVVTRERLDTAPPPALLRPFEVIRVDGRGVDGVLGLDELHYAAARVAPAPLMVEIRTLGHEEEGPIAILRGSPDARALAWIVLGGLGLLALFLLPGGRAGTPVLPPTIRASSLALGATTGALLVGVLSTDHPNVQLSWMAALGALWWRGLSFGDRMRTDSDGVLGLGGVLVAVVIPGLLGLGVLGWAWSSRDDPSTYALGLTTLVAMFALVHVADGVVHRRVLAVRGLDALRLVLGGLPLVIYVVLISVDPLWNRAPAAEAALLASVTVGWLADLALALPVGFGEGRQRRDDKSPQGLGAALVSLDEAARPHAAALAIGTGGTYILVDRWDAAMSGEGRVRTRTADDTMTSALEMLVEERGMYPRPARSAESAWGDGDAFDGWGEAIGVTIAVPMYPDGDVGLTCFALAMAEEEVAYEVPNAEGFVARVDDVATSLVYAELVALFAESVGGTPEVQGAVGALQRPTGVPTAGGADPQSDQSEMSTSAPQTLVGSDDDRRIERPMFEAGADGSPSVSRDDVARAKDEMWIGYLEGRISTSYPIDDTDALDLNEVAALERLFTTDEPALLVGEAGIGKEFLARAIHALSDRADHRFAVLDCSVTPPLVVEGELFGYEDEPGLVELVGEGTLLLKSLSRMERALVEDVLQRVGAAPCRLILAERYHGPEPGIPATIASGVRKAVADRFIHLTPLRDRPSDVRRYAQLFVHRCAMQYDRIVVGFDPSAMEALEGNELRANFYDLSALVRAAVLRAGGSTITLDDLDLAPDSPDVIEHEEDQECVRIVNALNESDGNRSEAARRLKMTRGKLLRRMKKYGLD